ncbi:MAG TPA: DUF2799 domain-containing protein [Steroidobacteraceae bacterium]|nr:DUF2799 domain-containing protein [Steroidobacteraceae bacterium]
MKHIGFALGIGMLSLGLLGGCATLSEGECRNSDWYDIGFRDGRTGEPQDRLSRHAGACADHGIAPDRERYLQGHDAGLELYCTQHNGLVAGESGATYQGVCRLGEEDAFLSGYQVGHALYRVRSRLSSIDSEIQGLDKSIAAEETEKKELANLIYRRIQLEGERGAAREELRQLEVEADAI